jgi:uncharacterized protein (DUF488 family)
MIKREAMLKRHRQLLSFVEALGGHVGDLDFQKLLFLYCQEEDPGLYEFVPYKFGAFSFTSYADRRSLAARGLVEGEHGWTLTGSGRRATERPVPRGMAAFARATAHLRGDALVAETYRRFPYYATRSQIADTVLVGDEVALQRVADARPRRAAGLLTIGYEGRSLEAYLNLLLTSGVTILCDVRKNPISRKYGFSKKTLANGCEGVGIRYEHLPELGVPSTERQHLDSQADYDALFRRYATTILPSQSPAIATIAAWIQNDEAVALTCYERHPHQCHRHCVAIAVEKTAFPITTQHL